MLTGSLFLKNQKWGIYTLLIHYHIMTIISILISEIAFKNSFQVKKIISETKQICFASDFSKTSSLHSIVHCIYTPKVSAENVIWRPI